MNNINLLKNKIDTKVMNFVLLSVVTGGIYSIMWLFLNQPKLAEEMKSEFVLKTIHYGSISLGDLASYYQILV